MKTWMACVVLMALAGCGANFNTSYRTSNLDRKGAVVITMDAKQRSIISNYREYIHRQGGVETHELTRRFCSEPSPDVYSVLAQSFGAGGSFSKGASPASLEAAINLAFSASEQGATIQRTQTINMLRESMFRTCERFVSGGYDEAELSVQAVRDQRLMVSILAIEQLTGAVTPKPIIIGTSANAASGATGEAIVKVAEAREARNKAESSLAATNEAYSKENQPDTVCDAIAGKKEEELTEAQKAKVAPCNKVRDARSDAKAKHVAAVEAHEELSRLTKTGGVSASTNPGAPVGQGGLDQVANSGLSEISETVRYIVDRNFNDDSEVLMFCLKALQAVSDADVAKYALDPIKDNCIIYLKAKIDATGGQFRDEYA